MPNYSNSIPGEMFEIFKNNLEHAIRTKEFDLDAIGGLIAQAIIDCRGDYDAAHTALSEAKKKLSTIPACEPLLQCFEGALYQLEVAAEPD